MSAEPSRPGGHEDAVAGGQASTEQPGGRGRDGKLLPGTSIGKPHRWPKGVSGNPGGRPRRADSILSQLAAELTETKARKIAARLIKMAEEAENGPALAAIREILDRLDGTVTKRVEFTGEIRKTVVLSRPDDGPKALEPRTVDAKVIEPVCELASDDDDDADPDDR